VVFMKSIKESEYIPSMGILIDVRDPVSYKEGHNRYSINNYHLINSFIHKANPITKIILSL